MLTVMCVLLVLAFSARVAAVPTEETLPRWSSLPTSTIQALALADGLLWVGTEEGLVRFDGQSFAEVRGFGAAKPHITALAANGAGGVWVGTLRDGLWLVHRGQAKRIAGGPQRILTVAPKPPAEAWVGTSEGTLFLARSGFGWEKVWDWTAGEAILALLPREGGELWVGTSSQGVWRCRKSQAWWCEPLRTLPQGAAVAVVSRDSTSFWVALRHHGIWFVKGEHEAQSVAPEVQALRKVTSLSTATDGQLWVGTDGEGVWCLHPDGNVGRRFLPGETVFAVAAGPEGVWAGLLAHGLVRLVQATAAKVRGSSKGLVFSVCQTPDGCGWFGGAGGLVRRVCGDRVETWELAAPEQPRVLSVVPASLSGVWAGTGGHGVWLVVPGKRSEKVSQAWQLPSSLVRCLRPTENGLLVGTDAGLGEVRNPHSGQPQSRLLLAGVAVTCLEEDHKGRLFVGTRRRGVAVVENEKVQWIGLETPLAAASVSDMVAVAGQGLWITTAGDGLFLWHEGALSRWTTVQGLPTSRLGSIVRDHNGNLWIGTNQGVLVVDPRTLTPDQAPNVRVGTYDGFLAEETVCLSDPAAWPAADGSLLFATVSGVYAVRPETVEALVRAPVAVELEGVETDGEFRPVIGEPLAVPPNPKRVRFALAAPGLLAGPRLVLRYRLRPLEETWHTLPPGQLPTYTFLPPGAYTLEVQAQAWPQRPPVTRSWTVHVPRLWWQSRWLRAVGLLAGLGLVAGLGYLRWRWLIFKNSLAEERIELAERLHHDLAQILTAAKLQLESQPSQATRAKELLDEALQRIRGAVFSPLAPPRHRSFPGHLRAWYARRLAGTGFRVEVAEVGPRAELSPKEEEVLFRLAQEAITNALRHGGARRVVLQVRWEKENVVMTVHDDGQGLSEKTRMGGGVSGLWRAVSERGGSLRIATGGSGGTEVEISIPRQK